MPIFFKVFCISALIVSASLSSEVLSKNSNTSSKKPSMSWQKSRCHDWNSFPKFEKERGASLKRIIFFASWCLSCVEKIKVSRPESDVIVGVMDERSRIDEAYRFLKVTTPCFYGGKSAEKRFSVKELPYSLTLGKEATLKTQ